MKLLTVGIGKEGVEIAEIFAKRGAKVNNAPLFKCHAISSDVELIKSAKAIPDKNRYYVVYRNDGIELTSALNSMLSRYEIFEGSMLTFALDDDFAFQTAMEMADELKDVTEEPVMALVTIPTLDEADFREMGVRLRNASKKFDVPIIFERRDNYRSCVLDSLNTIALVGEIDLKKKRAGEVVVDTSDVFNAIRKKGLAVLGMSRQKLLHHLIRRIVYRKESELKAIRTKRMVDMVDESLSSLSVDCDVTTARSALLVFSGEPEEITMDGLFACISRIERVNPGIEIRYGDYPVPGSNSIASIVIFSGITRLVV